MLLILTGPGKLPLNFRWIYSLAFRLIIAAIGLTILAVLNTIITQLRNLQHP